MTLETKLNKNYIGVTGFTNELEVKQVMQAWQKYEFKHHELMLGFLISPRNLDKNWSSKRYPRLLSFRPLLSLGADHFSTIHIDSKNTDSWLDSLIALIAIILNKMGDQLIKGIQVNVIDPKLEDLKLLNSYLADIDCYSTRIILQYSSEFLGLQGTHDEICNRIKTKLEPLLDYCDTLLIDPSRGRGITIDIDHGIEHGIFIDSLKQGLTIGFAGGLSPDNVFEITRKLAIARGFNFSLDVESKVRTPDQSSIDLQKVDAYFNNIYRALYIEDDWTCPKCGSSEFWIYTNYSACGKCDYNSLDEEEAFFER